MRDQMTFVPVDDAREVLAVALEGGQGLRPHVMAPQDRNAPGMVAQQGLA
jgi:hypothetical protein